MVFDDLNRISDIPIHRTSNKYKKIGSGVVYYNNPADLLDRLELLGGSILAGNNGVKSEFSKIAHTLNKLGVLNNNRQLASHLSITATKRLRQLGSTECETQYIPFYILNCL